MANEFNASLMISTAEAVTNVRNVDAAAKDLDKTLAHLHTTMQTSQGDLDKVASSLRTFTATQRQATRDQKDRNGLLISEAKLEREQIVNKGKLAEATNKQAMAEAKRESIRKRDGRASVSSLGNEVRKNAESDARIANQAALTTQRLATEAERRTAAEHRTAAALSQRSSADARAEMTAMRLAAAQERARNASLALNDSLSNSRYLLYDVGATYATLSAILLAVPAATTAVAASFEKDFTQVIRTAGLVGEEIPATFAELRQLSKEIPLSFGEFANIASIAGQLGIAKDELGAFTETVAKFGAASNVAISDAATAFGRLENSFNATGETEDFFNRIGSSIAKVGVESAASETEIIAVTNQISAAGAQFGFTADQIVGLSGALASVRIRPELARGAFQRILLQLSRAADEGSESFDTFAKYTQQTGQAAIDLFKTNPSAFFQQYIAGIKGTIAAGNSVSSVLDDIGAKNVFDKQFILGLANGLHVYNKAMDDSAKAFKDGSFLNESTKATFETFSATLQKLGNALAGLGARLGGGTLKPLTDLAETVLNGVNAFDRMLEQAPAISALINGLLLFGTVTGVMLALKSAQAFVLAGLVGLQQVMGKASIAGALTLRGNISELAKTMLMAKGASAALATGLLQNRSAFQQLALATTATTASLARYNTVSNATVAGSGAVASGMSRAAAGAGAFGRGLLGVVGGPLGAIVIGLGALVTNLISTEEQANQAGDSIARAFKNGADAGNRAIAESLADRKVGLLDNIWQGNMDKTVADLAKEVGMSFDSIVLSVAKGEDAAKQFQRVLNDLGRSRGGADFADALSKGLISEGENQKIKFIMDNVLSLAERSQKAAGNVKSVDDAVAALEGSANSAAPAADGLADGLENVSEKAEDTKSKIEEAVNAIFGIVNAELATQDSLARLGESLFNSTSMSTQDEGGRENVGNFEDVLRNAALQQQQLIDSGEQTIEQASANYISFINGLMSEMASKGVDVTQVQALADQAKGIFGVQLATGFQPAMGVEIDTSKVEQAKAYLDSVVAVYGTTNLDVIMSLGGDAQLRQNVFDSMQYVQDATGTPYTAVVDADANPLYDNVEASVEWGYNVLGTPFTAVISADASPFEQVMQFVQQYAATVVNGIIDGINAINQAGHDLTGGLLAANQIGRVGWGEMPQAPAAPQVAARPDIPSRPRPSAGSDTQKQLAQTRANQDALGGLRNAYDDAATAAEEAGEKGKKAGEDAANGIDKATEAADDYASRLREGLQSAFDKQHAYNSAVDAYQSALNSIRKKREDELQQVQDLIEKQKELNNSRKEDLVTARKAGIEKAISLKYGEGDRANDYATQEQEALDSAAAKQKDIDATKKQASEIQAGIGKLTGYSQAAIDNRAALRDLESKMLDVIGAYAGTGASVDQVKAKAIALTGQFKKDVSQLGLNKGAVAGLQGSLERYIGVVGKVPRVKPTKVEADTAGASRGIQGIKNQLAGLTNKRVRVDVDKYTKNWYLGSVMATPNKTKAGDQIYRVIRPDGTATNNMLFNKGGLVPGFASGGLIPGRSPSNPNVDNLMAQVDGKGMVKVRSGEFIVQEPAVDYWGLDFFRQLNNMKMPQFNAGGSVGGRAGGTGPNGAMLVELTAEAIAAIQRMPPIILTTENRVIAQAANDGNAILATQGAN